MGWISLIFTASLLSCSILPVFTGEHALFYTYTALSKPLELPGIYEFTALGMLDDHELDYYSSQNQTKIPKQDWMRENMEDDYWEKGTQSRRSKEQWFKVNVGILMDRMRHNASDLHVLQWRHGCVVDKGTDGTIMFVRGVDEYSYDGSEFLSFDDVNSRWIAPVQAAEPTKRKWDEVQILNQYTKGYLEKECVDWLRKFMDYGQESFTKMSPPKVHKFLKKSLLGPDMMTLTCLATGFYPKDVEMRIRKSRTSIPEFLLTSSGVRPNGDGTYQLRKSVEVTKDEQSLYDCYVNHISLEKPIIVNGGKDTPCMDCTKTNIMSGIIGGVVVGVLALIAVGVVVLILKRKGIIGSQQPRNEPRNEPGNPPAYEKVSMLPNPEAQPNPDEVKVPILSGEKESDDTKNDDSDSGKGSGDSARSSQEKVNQSGKPGEVSN